MKFGPCALLVVFFVLVAATCHGGNRALATLLLGARKLLNDPPRKMKYIKFGGSTSARNEVRSLAGRQWTELVTKEGAKRGKIVGDRFFEVVPATKVYPAMVRVSKMRQLKQKKITVLEQPVEIKYLKGTGRAAGTTRVN